MSKKPCLKPLDWRIGRLEICTYKGSPHLVELTKLDCGCVLAQLGNLEFCYMSKKCYNAYRKISK